MDIILTKDQTILKIGCVELNVVKTTESQVKFGITAPKNIQIIRSELLESSLDELNERVRKFKNYEI